MASERVELMRSISKGALVAITAFILAIVLIMLSFWSIPISKGEMIKDAPELSLVDQYGKRTNLSSLHGNVTVLHITQLEYPLCLECEASIIEQLEQLRELVDKGYPNLTVVTINLRKNVYSDPGWMIAERYYGINISWSWMEEIDPYPNAYSYIDFWQYKAGLSNPTLLLIDGEQRVVGIYHVYVVSQGSIDGVRSASAIYSDVERIQAGEWGDVLIGSTEAVDLSLWGMFALGALTSFSPCSLALLMTMVLYIGASGAGPGRSGKGRNGVVSNLGIGIAFTLGIAMTFMLIGLFLGYLGELLTASTVFYIFGGVVLIILGINAIRPLRDLFGRKDRGTNCDTCDMPRGRFGKLGRMFIERVSARSRPLAGFSLGALFSLGWAPCALSLVFPMLLLMIAQGLPLIETATLMLVFGLGHGLIVIPLCVTTGEVQDKIQDRYVDLAGPIKFGFGAAIFVMGILFIIRYWGILFW